jgi:head-tail adaptor
MYGAGDLDQFLGLYEPSSVADAIGQPVFTWHLRLSVAAKRVPMRANERFLAAQTQADVWDRFVIRVGPVITPAWRIVWRSGAGAPAFDVVAATPMTDRQWLELICRGRPDGLQ